VGAILRVVEQAPPGQPPGARNGRKSRFRALLHLSGGGKLLKYVVINRGRIQ